MSAADQSDLCVDSGLKLRLEPIRKMDINKLKSSARSEDAVIWLDKIKAARAGADVVFDCAWKAVSIRGTEALIWITQDGFCQYNYTVRIVPMINKDLDIDFWLELIQVVHKNRTDAVSINWLLGPDQTAAHEALTRWNYRFVSCLRAEMPEPGSSRRRDVWLYRTDALLRPDIGVGFVAFKFGWLAVSGSCRGISKIDFVRTGSKITDTIMAMHAQYSNLLDEKGMVHGPGAKEILAKDTAMQLPLPVIKAVEQLEEYLAGKRRSFDLELEREHSSFFQQRVWDEISSVPYGVTATYEDLAVKLSSPGQKPRTLARAVGTACASNPLPLVVPCHRIIGKNGRLTGFNGGVDIKEYLLNHEMFGLK